MGKSLPVVTIEDSKWPKFVIFQAIYDKSV